jgi:hypothetical protein
MKPIPIKAAQEIADRYGYDQVVIVARKVDQPAGVGETAKAEIKGGEHVTTYGRDKANCEVAARMGDFFKHKLMGWPVQESLCECGVMTRDGKCSIGNPRGCSNNV